ncbi:hypothetical protein NDU88_001673 [Pleurodeles waltl]|uniref:Uncharacterized protein n=1 Tax=Pleurodeles waltl TaxID=8319 RepID=A0AAV7VZM0_PLEWA|nr:hypothetical protein NDU88_001673 [Pleurodeles waltl]
MGSVYVACVRSRCLPLEEALVFMQQLGLHVKALTGLSESKPEARVGFILVNAHFVNALVYLSDFAVNMTEEEDSQVFQENLKSFIKDSDQQAVAVSMSEVTKNVEASFFKIMTSSKVPVNKGKKRAATFPVPSKGVSSGPSTREVSKSGPPPSPVHVTHLRDTDDDDDDSSHTDDVDGSADPFLCGPLEKRRKISPSDGGDVHPVSHILVDHAGEPLFDPSFMVHPNSKEWYPSDHVADYVSFFLRHPLDKATRNKLKSEAHIYTF